MSLFKKSAKVFTTWKNSLKSSSESKPKQRDDHTDAMSYLSDAQRRMEYEEALRRINPSMTHSTMNAAAQSMWPASQGFGNTGQQMGAVNQAWANVPLAIQPKGEGFMIRANTIHHFQVEKVDNGYILRSGNYVKICKDMDELKDLFVSVMVEHQLDK